MTLWVHAEDVAVASAELEAQPRRSVMATASRHREGGSFTSEVVGIACRFPGHVTGQLHCQGSLECQSEVCARSAWIVAVSRRVTILTDKQPDEPCRLGGAAPRCVPVHRPAAGGAAGPMGCGHLVRIRNSLMMHDATNEHGQDLVTIKPGRLHDQTVRVPWQQSGDSFRGVGASAMVCEFGIVS